MNRQLTNIVKNINKAIETGSSFLMIFLLFLTFSNVIGRYVFNKSIYFSDELARFIFVWIVFLGIAKIVKDRRQVTVSLLKDKLHGSVGGFVVETVVFIAGLLFLVVAFSGGIQLTVTMNLYSSAALGIPMGFVYLAIPIGSGLTIIYHIVNYFLLIGEYKSTRQLEEN